MYVAYVCRYTGSVKQPSAHTYARNNKKMFLKSTAKDILNIFTYSYSPWYYTHFDIHVYQVRIVSGGEVVY
jgi:hypothetical protein